MTFWAVIPAGGAGTRLWPLSRQARPKFLLDPTGAGRTLIQQTRDRLRPLTDDRVLVVTGLLHAAEVGSQLDDLPRDHILAEPSARDSMAAMGLAAAVLELRDPDAVMGAFPADHVISDPAGFRSVVTTAVSVAAESDLLVTLGIDPTHPATGFGYIRLGAALGETGAYAVEEFVEKPDAERAASYLAQGGFRWNAGMFVVRPTVLLALLAAQDPDFAASLRALAAAPDRLDELWPTLTKISVDYAVAEPAAAAGRVAVVPGAFGWDDIGDFASLRELAGNDALNVIGPRDLVVSRDATGLVVPGSGRTVAVIGLEDIVVVDTPDALLVSSTDRAQDVKWIVDELRERAPGLL